MDDVFLGEIRYVAFNYAPLGWALCNGQVIPIQQNTALFALLGVTFGGNGTTTFALPDYQGRIPVGAGEAPGLSPYDQGQQAGSESVTLTTDQVPPHSHLVAASSAVASLNDPTQGVFAKPNVPRNGGPLYAAAGGAQAASDTINVVGRSLPHENRAPGLAMTAIIALQGVFPQRP